MKKEIHVIGVPYAYGSAWEDSRHAPGALRRAGLIEFLAQKSVSVFDDGDIYIKEPEPGKKYARSHVPAITRKLYQRITKIYDGGGFPLTIGGDHSIAVGPALATQQHFGKIGLISIDRHTDLSGMMDAKDNPPFISCANFVRILTTTDPAKIVGPLAVSAGYIRPENTAIIGVNCEYDLGWLRPSNKHMIANDIHIQKYGAKKVAEEAISQAIDGTNGIYLTFDIDALNTEIAPGTGYPGGPLDLDQAKTIVSMIANSGYLLGADLVEVHPKRDEGGVTMRSAMEIIGAMF